MFRAQSFDAPGALGQYGAIGLMLLGAIYAVRTLFAREIRAHDLERQRADRMEAEVARLNNVIVEFSAHLRRAEERENRRDD